MSYHLNANVAAKKIYNKLSLPLHVHRISYTTMSKPAQNFFSVIIITKQKSKEKRLSSEKYIRLEK
jgi:hypothetical protein